MKNTSNCSEAFCLYRFSLKKRIIQVFYKMFLTVSIDILLKRRICFLLAANLMAASFAIGQGKQTDTVRIDRLLTLPFEDLMNVSVITPSRFVQNAGEAPATVLVVTGDQIRLRGYRSLAEILNDLPDFTVNSKSDGQFYNLIGARGIFRQDYFVILLDGVRISSPTNEPLPIIENFPIYFAKQIEIVYGPGSALYGADAMAGVINIITDKSGDQPDITISAMGGTQGYSNESVVFQKNLQNDVKLTVAGQYVYDAQPDFSKIYKEAFDISSHRTGVFNTFYGPMQPSSPVRPTFEAPVKAYNVYASLGKGPFSIKVLHHYAAVPSSTGLSPDNAVYNKEVFYGQGVTTASTSYTADFHNLKSVSTLATSFYKVNPKSNFRNLYGSMEPGYKYSTGSMIKLEEQLDYSFSEKINLVGGLTYQIFQSVPKTPELMAPVTKTGSVSSILLNTVSENNPQGIPARFFPLEYRNFGSYIQAQYVPIKALSVTAGIRYDNNSRFGSTVNPRIGGVFHLFEGTTVKAMYGTAYWAPSPMITFNTYGSFYTTDGGITYQSDYLHLPNPDLKPVTSRSFELSVLQSIGEHLKVTLSTHITEARNLINDVADNGNTNRFNNKFLGWDVAYIEVPFNNGLQKNYGGSLILNSTFGIGEVEFNAYSSASYLEGMVQDASADMETEQSLIIPWQFRAGLDGKFHSFHFSVRMLSTSQQRGSGFVDPADPRERKTIPGYMLLNASAGYAFTSKTTMYINVYNALDARYLNALDWDSQEFEGSYQDPIRAVIGVRTGF